MTEPKQTSQAKAELEVLFCESIDNWSTWLEANHAVCPGVWLRLAKKTAPFHSVSYAEALEVALCYGWIDGQSKKYNDNSWLQKFTPRAHKSLWSKVNREKVAGLIASGRMQPAGLAEVERAKADGRWDAAYDPASRAQVPDDFQVQLDKHPAAQEFFATLNSQNRYAILCRIQTAKKAETRTRRIQQFIEMLERHEKIYS
jgi:uncharacterized protein YdeI (YjbR/CyaY-like superfamily)